MSVELGAEYLVEGATPEERHWRRQVTGDPEADFVKLCRQGCIDGHVANGPHWRKQIRLLARRAKVRIQTLEAAEVPGFVVAVTRHYEEWLRTPEGESHMNGVILEALKVVDRTLGGDDR